jgi:type II secretory pathway predicted ATPase ExeA
MDTRKMQGLYGLKWNPFSPEVPTDSLLVTPKAASFCHRIESLVLDGGFAMITGEPGTGKSVMLRLLAERLGKLRDLAVTVLCRPQSGMVDFYREIATLSGLPTSISNRWGSYRSLRDKWLAHIESTLLRPVLLIDEAQEMPAPVLCELRLLSSVDFDSKSILTVILCGDTRLPERFRSPDLAPLGSRIRTRYRAETAGKEEMIQAIQERLEAAGNQVLMTNDLIETLVDHSAGNYRVLLQSADELLAHAMERDAKQLDTKLFFDLYQPPETRQRKVGNNNQRKG